MTATSWSAALVSSQVDGSALSNSTTPTSILPAAAKFTLPNNTLFIGKRMRITAQGRISTVVTTPGTLTFSLRWGTGPVIVATSDALALNVVAKSSVAWHLEWNLTCRAIGGSTSANLMHNGLWISEAVVGSPVPGTGGNGVLSLVAASPAVGTGFDSTAAQIMDLFATFSVANASNSITCHQYMVEELN
jgi:hypothetical protein